MSIILHKTRNLFSNDSVAAIIFCSAGIRAFLVTGVQSYTNIGNKIYNNNPTKNITIATRIYAYEIVASARSSINQSINALFIHYTFFFTYLQ